jgi:hypothetical protein
MAEPIDIAEVSPLRLAGVGGGPATAGALKVRPVAHAPAIARSDVDLRASARMDSFQFSSPARAAMPIRTTMPDGPSPGASRMVAATVGGRIDFQEPASQTDGALPMYRHPADRNAAATAVNAGRVLDVEG